MHDIRVCVADDSVETAEVLCEGLRLNEYEAIPASSGEEALAVCEQGGIDLILLDVCMPDMDGYEVCRRLKENPRTRDIVVLFVTVKGTQEDIRKGYSLGAADYITKPFNLPMVMVRVDAAMRRNLREKAAELESDSLVDTTFTDELTGLRNRSYLLQRLHEEVDHARRGGEPLSVVVFDLDEVEAVDPDLGPVSLDDLLAEFAMTLRTYSRTYDILARYDGSLFAAVLPHCPLTHAVCYADKIFEEVEGTTFSDPNFPTKARISIGVASAQPSDGLNPDAVLGEAMRSLLQAKSRTGRRLVARAVPQRETKAG